MNNFINELICEKNSFLFYIKIVDPDFPRFWSYWFYLSGDLIQWMCNNDNITLFIMLCNLEK